MFEAWDRYRIDRIRPEDTVLDLGANIGSFTLPAAKVARMVYAVEPLFHEELRRNVELNRFDNVEVLPYAVGTDIVDAGLIKPRKVSKLNLGSWYLAEGGPKIDVIRMDIGGAEWNLDLIGKIELGGVRQWEIEFHFYKDKGGSWKEWKGWFGSEGYSYVARWSKHKHWLYVSAEKGVGVSREVQLTDGSFRGESLEKWKGQ
jgi:hypothetical protein